MDQLKFQKEQSALVIIDMQNAFLDPQGSLSRMGLDTSRAARVINPIQRLRDAFHAQNRPVVFIQHTHRPDKLDAGLIAQVFPPIMAMGHCFDGSWDQQFIGALQPDQEKGDIVVKKHRFSAFYNTPLAEILKSLGAEQLVVTGIATNICVESTVRDAFYRDINVFVPEEATAGFTPEEEQAALNNFRFAFARVVPLEDILQKMAEIHA